MGKILKLVITALVALFTVHVPCAVSQATAPPDIVDPASKTPSSHISKHVFSGVIAPDGSVSMSQDPAHPMPKQTSGGVRDAKKSGQSKVHPMSNAASVVRKHLFSEKFDPDGSIELHADLDNPVPKQASSVVREARRSGQVGEDGRVNIYPDIIDPMTKAPSSIIRTQLQELTPKIATFTKVAKMRPNDMPEARCFEEDTNYTPDMSGQGRSVETSEYQCQQRCASVSGCAHFTYWPNENSCHLQGGAASSGADSWGATAGPPYCALARCFEEDTFYSPDMSGQDRSVETSEFQCQQRCASVSGCAHFTYWPNENSCHLQDSAASSGADSWGATAGPPYCCGFLIEGRMCSIPGVRKACCAYFKCAFHHHLDTATGSPDECAKERADAGLTTQAFHNVCPGMFAALLDQDTFESKYCSMATCAMYPCPSGYNITNSASTALSLSNCCEASSGNVESTRRASLG